MQNSSVDNERLLQAKKEIETMLQQIKSMLAEKNDASLPDFARDVPPLQRVRIAQRRELKGHLAKVYALQWSDDNQRLVSASQDGKLLVWDAPSRNKVHAIQLRTAWVMSCAYSASGSLVACGGLDNICSVYNIRSGQQPIRVMRELPGHTGYISGCRFLNDRQILTSSGDGTAVLWDIDSTSRITTFVDHLSGINCLSLSPDKNNFITGSCDRTAKLWDLRTGPKCVHTFYPPPPPEKVTGDINAVAYFPSGQAFCSGGDDQHVRLWDLRAARELLAMHRPDVPHAVSSLAFSVSGRLVFAGYEAATVQIWDVLRGERVGSLQGHTGRVTCLGVSNDGLALATGSWDHSLRVWA